MPSGAKRRRKAKKKKGEANQSNASSANTSDTNDQGYDTTTQDERDSDGGEVGALARQVQQNRHHSFHEGDSKSKKKEASSVKPALVWKKKSMDEVPKGAESSVVQIDWQLKPDEDSESRDVTVGDYRRSSSSSSSSDDSRAAKKELKEETSNSTSGPSSNEVNPVINGSSIDKLSVSDAVDRGLKEIEEKLVTVTNIPTRVPSEETIEKVLPPSGGPSAETSNVPEAGNTRDSESSQVSEKQPLLATNPPVAQRTSWLSCCGLCDLFSNSGR